MPELPEVETVKRGLTTLLIGHVVTKVIHDTPKSFPNAPIDVKQFLIGARQYIYGAAAALSALYLAFWPDQSPLSIVCTILALLAFVALTYIITTPQQKHS